ncbi:YciI family protein [Roseobacteraceae bacterium NS-SX3]
MFVVFLKFSAGKDRAAGFMEGHKAWLAQGFSDGVFLAAGSIDEGQGGAILAHGCTRAELEDRVAADPFVIQDVVTADVTGFTPSATDARLAFLKGAA